MPSLDRRPVVCIAEDRKTCEPALKLLLTSLCHYNADIRIMVFYPAAERIFVDWAAQFGANVIDVRTTPLAGAYGWNVKPQALLQLLSEGHGDVIWIDSDIIVTKDIRAALPSLDSATLVISEEALWGKRDDARALRARLWGFAVKRSFPFTLNSAVLRVTHAHTPLLERWKALLESPEYRAAQQLPWNVRPAHMLGDQDVLTGLLCSKEFSGIPVKILRRGADIIQYFGPYGFTLAERAVCMARGMPTFIHSQGAKPWLKSNTVEPSGFRRKLEALYLDLSPYTLAAIALSSSSDRTWTRPRSAASSTLRNLAFGSPPLAGLPLAAAFDTIRAMVAIRKYLASSQPIHAFRSLFAGRR